MSEKTKVVPQALYAVTLAAGDIKRQRQFYEGWGWEALPYSNEEFAAFSCGSAVVSFYVKEKLAEEAAAGQTAPEGWTGVTLAVSLPTRDEVDPCWRGAVAAGATEVGQPVDRPWGGRSGYVADPEGNRWEILWIPPIAGQ